MITKSRATAHADCTVHLQPSPIVTATAECLLLFPATCWGMKPVNTDVFGGDLQTCASNNLQMAASLGSYGALRITHVNRQHGTQGTCLSESHTSASPTWRMTVEPAAPFTATNQSCNLPHTTCSVYRGGSTLQDPKLLAVTACLQWLQDNKPFPFPKAKPWMASAISWNASQG